MRIRVREHMVEPGLVETIRKGLGEAKGDNWVAYYFCEDPQGTEWAVSPHAINGIGNARCVNARGGNDSIAIEYVLDECTPIEDVKGSGIYGKVKELEDRDIVALTRDEAERIVLADDRLKELKAVVAPKDEAADSRRVDDYANMRFFDPEEFVKYVRKAYGKDGGYVSIDSVVPVSVLDKANRMAQKNGYSKLESKKSEDASSVDDLLARHNQKWLVKVSYDVDASHSAVAPSIVRADTKDAATNIALKRHRGLGYNMKVVSVEPMTESRKKSEDFDMNQAFFQAKKAITDWTKRQGHKTLEWLYTDGRKSPTSYPSGIWDFEWDTGNGMATAELKVSPYETRTNSWNDSMDFGLRVGTEDKPTFYTSVEDVLSALDTLISKTEIKMESKKSESLTLKQKELKDMARYGEAEDITTISDAEAKELKKKGIETVGVSRGTYGMNGALLRDREGNKYVITARSSNLFYFV